MANWAQLKAFTTELSSAIESLTGYQQIVEACPELSIQAKSTAQPIVPPGAPIEAQRARNTVLANICAIHKLLAEPVDFLQELVRQNQVLACINWLGEFQVLACVPLRGSVPFQDIAELVGVPEIQLSRVVRMTATAGFLHEPYPAHVAHSRLSASFVTKPSYLDATMFLCQTAAPAAMHMAGATQRFGQSQRPCESAFNVAQNSSVPLTNIFEQRSKIQRQWPAYLRHALGGDAELSVIDVLSCLDWLSLGKATVVEVGAHSTATALALADRYPALQLIIQLSGPPSPGDRSNQEILFNSWALTPSVLENRSSESDVKMSEIPPHLSHRITVSNRVSATTQSVIGAAVYLIHLPCASPTVPSRSLPAQVVAELKAHLDVLRACSGSKFLLAVHLRPEPIIKDQDSAIMAHLRDLSLFQLVNDRDLGVGEFMNILNSIGDGIGHLVVVNELRGWRNTTVAFEIRYEANTDYHRP